MMSEVNSSAQTNGNNKLYIISYSLSLVELPESPHLSSPLIATEHDQANADSGPDCYSRLCVEPLDEERGERPVSMVSTLSSGSSRDSRSLFGSTVALPSSSTPPIASEEDIDLELSPTEGIVERARDQSPTLTGTSGHWQEQLEPRVISNQWNNNNASPNKRASAKILQTPASPVVTDTMAPNPKLTYVDRVVMEIIETERMYVKDLRSIVEDYLAHIIDMSNLPIRPEQVCALFGNIEDIYEFNSELLQSLDMCENDPVAIAQCFVDKSEYFEIYTQYCTNYPNSVAALTDCMRNKTLAKFFRDRQAALKCSLPLGSYLLKPVQRILKYHLLLQEIAKHFDPYEEGYDMVQEAIETMTGVAWYINDMKRKHEHAVRVQEIQSLLINWKGPDLTTSGELVLEGTFHVLRAKNTRTLFLFEKMLLITKKRGEHYVYKTHILCSTLMLLDSAKDPLLFSVIHFKHPKQPHTVQPCSSTGLAITNHMSMTSRYSMQTVRVHCWGIGAPFSQPLVSVRWAEGPCVEDLIPRSESLEQLSHPDSDPKLGSSLSEGGMELQKAEGESYKEDVLMGEDQVADFASSVLAAISCWHIRARALLSTHFPTVDQSSDGAELKTAPGEEADAAVKEPLSTQVNVEELLPPDCVPQAKSSDQPEMNYSQRPESPVSPSQMQETVTPEPTDTSRETGEEDEEGGSDSSGLHVEETSVLTNGELSEEDEEVLLDSKSILPSSVLNQASVIAERFIGSLSRRSSLVSEDLGSLACPVYITDDDAFKIPSGCMDLENKTKVLVSSSPEPHVTSEVNLSSPVHEPALRPTLSKRDRLLIHKIRRYYEHAEHQDANFSIKRRESLSYIPAGLVRHLSRQLNSIPQEEQAIPASRKGLSHNRPTSWSVFDLPGLETRQKTVPQRSVEAKARSQSLTDSSTTEDEEFRPSSDMVWQYMELEEKGQKVQQTVEEKVTHDISLDMSDVKTSEQASQNLEDSASDGSCISSPTTNLPAVEGGSGQDSQSCKPLTSQDKNKDTHGQLPKIISFRTSVDEDQILQDMGKMTNKVFQLARQYSQRIKNNRPTVWQRNRETASHRGFKSMPAVHEEKIQMRKKAKCNLNTCDQEVSQELHSPSPVQTSSSQCTVTCPQSPESDTFHWPDVQELRSKYAPFRLETETSQSCTGPNGMLGRCTKRCNGCSHRYNSSSDLQRALTDCTTTQSPDWTWPRPRLQPLLCRWSSLDHMLGSPPLHEVQNLQDPVRSCYTSSQVSLITRETRDSLLQEDLDCPTMSFVQSSGKVSESNLVKGLREKFQSLSTSS
ncbi:hypothetical protein PAMP_005462 [Pampus punctatissimus]